MRDRREHRGLEAFLARRKELALLEPDMLGESLGERHSGQPVPASRGDHRLSKERMIARGARHELVGGRAGQRREEELFLDPKVRLELIVEAEAERRASELPRAE